jgi:hypothetical protein
MILALRSKTFTRLLLAALLLGGMSSCNFGEPTVGGGGTGVEGLSGVIVGPTGKPAAGAWVKVYPITPGLLAKSASGLLPIDSVQVDATGAFNLPTIAQGTYTLVATLVQGDSTLTLLLSGIVVADRLELEPDTLRLAGSVTVQFQTNGIPLADADCIIVGTPFFSKLDSAGNCTLAGLPPGNFEITLEIGNSTVGVYGDLEVLSGILTDGGVKVVAGGLLAVPLAPILLAPNQNAMANYADSLFWSAPFMTTSYHLQVTTVTDTSFISPVINDSALTTNRFALSPFAAGGTWSWRVRARNQLGHSPWSPRRTFVIGGVTASGFHFALTPSTVALWRFDESDQVGTIQDVGPNGLHLVPVSTSVPLEPSPAGKAAVFNGTTHKLRTPFDSALTLGPTGKLTIEAHIKLSAYPAESLLGSGSDVVGSYAGLALKIRSDGTFLASVQKENSTGNFEWYGAYSAAGVVPLNRWTTLTISVDQTVSPHQFYGFIDGQPVQLHAVADARPIRIRAEPFMVGHRDNNDNVGFNGRIDEIRISNQLVLGAGHPLTPQLPVKRLTASKDALIWGSALDLSTDGVHSDKNSGAGDHLNVGVYDRSTITRSLFAFSIPAGTSGTAIDSATFSVHVREWHAKHVKPARVTLRVHRLLRSWTEGQGSSDATNRNSATINGVTSKERFYGVQDGTEDWNVKLVGLDGVDAVAAPSATISLRPGDTGRVDIDITALARYWADNPNANHGLIVVGDVPTDDMLTEHYPVFHSREANVPSELKPSLLLYFK